MHCAKHFTYIIKKSICTQVFVWLYIFSSLGYIPKRGSTGSYNHSMFNFLRNCLFFSGGWFILHPNQKYMSIMISPHSCQHLLFFFFFFYLKPSLVDMKRYLIVVLICFFLMTKDVEHHFMHLLASYISSWRNVYLNPLHISNLGYLSFLLLSYKSSLHIVDTRPLTDLQIFSLIL